MPTVNGTSGETGDGRTYCALPSYRSSEHFMGTIFYRNALSPFSPSDCVRGGWVCVIIAATERRRGGGGNNVVRGCWPKSAHSVYGVFTTPSSALATVYEDCLWRTLLAFLAWWERWTTTVDSGYPEAFPAWSRSAGRAFDHLGREQCQRRPIGL